MRHLLPGSPGGRAFRGRGWVGGAGLSLWGGGDRATTLFGPEAWEAGLGAGSNLWAGRQRAGGAGRGGGGARERPGAGPGPARECGAAGRVWCLGWFLFPSMAPRCWRWWPWSSWTRTRLPPSRSIQSRSRAPLGLGGSSGRPANDPVRSGSQAGAGLERGEGGDQGRD